MPYLSELLHPNTPARCLKSLVLLIWRRSNLLHQKKTCPTVTVIVSQNEPGRCNKAPHIDSTGLSVSSLNESHIDLLCQTGKFGRNEGARRMIHDMIANFPSCCVLGTDGKPVTWILTYTSCAIGMLYTLPEHRGKGYAKVVVNSIAERNHALGIPVFGFIEEENVVSYRLFKNMGFTEDSTYRSAWFGFDIL